MLIGDGGGDGDGLVIMELFSDQRIAATDATLLWWLGTSILTAQKHKNRWPNLQLPQQ